MATELVRNTRGSIRNRWRILKLCLFDPDRFFEEYVGTYGIRTEFFLVLVIGVVGAIGMVFAATELLAPFETGSFASDDAVRIDETAVLYTWGFAVQEFVWPFLLWLFYTLLFYAGSWFYTGRGTFFETLKYTAWGLLPLLFANLLSTIGAIYTFWQLDVETGIPGPSDEIAEYLFEQGLGEPLMLAVGALSIVFIAWSGYIWSYALAHAQEINRDEAIKVVAVAVLLHAGYVVWGLLGYTGIV